MSINPENDQSPTVEAEAFDLEAEEGERVHVKLSAAASVPADLKIQPSPLDLPINFERAQLSRLVNHMLEKTTPKIFDFLIENEFLRSSLSEYLRRKKQTSENVLNIVYIEALSRPRLDNDIPHPDWVSAISATSGSAKNKNATNFFSAAHDGHLRLWASTPATNAQQKRDLPVMSFQAHKKPITCLETFDEPNTVVDPTKKNVVVLTGAQDFLVKSFRVDVNQKTVDQNKIDFFKGHTSTVTSISRCPTPASKLFCSASWDTNIHIWSLDGTAAFEDDDDEEVIKAEVKAEDEPEKKGKKRRLDNGEPANTYEPILTLSGHRQAVNAVQWVTTDHVISASSDLSIKIWDVQSGVALNTMVGTEAVSAMAASINRSVASGESTSAATLPSTFPSSLIATGHHDRCVRLWDPRDPHGRLISKRLRSHKGWITSLDWHPTNQNWLISSSHDQTVKLWDIRSELAPLHSIKDHTDKVLSVKWVSKDTIVSGGADGRTLVHKLDNSSHFY